MGQETNETNAKTNFLLGLHARWINVIVAGLAGRHSGKML